MSDWGFSRRYLAWIFFKLYHKFSFIKWQSANQILQGCSDLRMELHYSRKVLFPGLAFLLLIKYSNLISSDEWLRGRSQRSLKFPDSPIEERAPPWTGRGCARPRAWGRCGPSWIALGVLGRKQLTVGHHPEKESRDQVNRVSGFRVWKFS